MRKQIMTLVLSLLVLGVPLAVAVSPAFSDMPEDWSRPALEKAVENGLLQGYGGRINASGLLSRAQMAAIVARAFGASEEADLSAYTDVSVDAWYYGDMAKSVAMGMFQGDGGRLNPTSPVTRQEALVALARVLFLEDGDTTLLQGYLDGDSVAPWAEGAVAAMVEAGYAQGSDGKLAPDSTITRAEFAQLMNNLVASFDQSEGTVAGSLVQRGPGEIPSGTVVQGDLIVADGVGAGTITLSGVTVEGRILVRSGATLILKDGTYPNVTVAAEGATVYLAGAQVEKLVTTPDTVVKESAGEVLKAVTAAEVFGTSAPRVEVNRHPWADATSNVVANGEEVNINLFVRMPNEYPIYTQTIYMDMFNRAILYKQAHPEEEVAIHFAMYNLYLNTYYYYNMDDPRYGELSAEYIEGQSEHLIHTLARAAQNGVKVDCVIQATGQQEEIRAVTAELMEEDSIFAPGKKVSDYWTVDFITWGGEGSEQMHCKLFAISDYLMDDGTPMHNAVFVSTNNIDNQDEIPDGTIIDKRERGQTSLLISGSTGLYGAVLTYMDLLDDFPDYQEHFRQAVRAAHADGKLNYSDDVFSIYFTPIPMDETDGWLPGYAPLVEWVEKLKAASGTRLFYCDAYHFNTEPYLGLGVRLIDTIRSITEDGKGPVLVKWVIETNDKVDTVYPDGYDGFLADLQSIGNGATVYKADGIQRTHCKDYLFAYEENGEMQYISITGSWNMKWDGLFDKANCSIAIKESGDYHPIFDCLAAQIDSKIPGTP